ncbi:hypothetical protein [Kutzneria buriramensis]|nr:hypothetical protein [Kutzneria buriramensis]
MPTTNGALVDQVRQHLDTARQNGEQPPGRPTLTKLTGASDWAIRRALEALEAEQATSTATPPAEPASAPGSATVPPTGTALDPSAPVAASNGAEGGLAAAGEAGGPLAPAPSPPEPSIDTRGEHRSRGGLFVAWAGFLFGAAVSIAANVLAARIPPEHAPAGWAPSVVAEIGAAVWPLGLLLSVEALSRVRWPKGAMWTVARFGGAGTVALGSAVISYGHINEVLTAWGYTVLGAGVGPLVIDGLMTICGFAMLAGSTASRHQPTTTDRQADTSPAPIDDQPR